MKVFTTAALAATFQVATSHFTFMRVAVNNEWMPPTRYIRNKTEPYTEPSTPGQPDPYQNIRLYNFPTYSSDTPASVRCGRDNMAHANSTETLKVKAGDTIDMAHLRVELKYWGPDYWTGCADNRGTCYPQWKQPGGIVDINHEGPFIVHLSKVPTDQDVSTYDGSGEWVKIHTLGLRKNNTAPIVPVDWLPYNFQNQPPHFTFSIPKQTPKGQYLMRVDIIWSEFWYLGKTNGIAQMYPSCVQIEVESEVEGELPRGVRIPEIFFPDQPGVATSLDMYRGLTVDANFTYAGGPLWDGVSLQVDTPWG
ncbi:glycosyl hydrolase family 61-domain-containing protein [Clohesyomyces aquaticus]|uniref:AA9 family lytic polysaccharide monooxygenase n=1 Tax=Clohesyomyces aquaticus TaxID=1231657 RepID=A0A1Y1ZWS7_9PLEO|nr:glycosyl hydrolase family 61-domain-containing protein [Clohesyomyces aquaticus]